MSMPVKKYVLSGAVVRGFGEGAYFMAMPYYQEEIKRKLGFRAYPGTLNLKVSKSQIAILKNIEQIKIGGFKKNNKTFGEAKCYLARIKNINGSIIVPELTRHKKDVVEFIAPVHIKSELKLKEGDNVKIELEKWQR